MNKYTIEDVLPHRAPMILVDSLQEYDRDSARCQVKIATGSPFYNAEKSGVPSYIGCEYMAQTIAAFAGAIALDDKGQVSIGFLLGSRKYKALKPYFHLGQVLDIGVKELYKEDSGLSVFECEISDNQTNILAHANINVFQPNDPLAFIEENG